MSQWIPLELITTTRERQRQTLLRDLPEKKENCLLYFFWGGKRYSLLETTGTDAGLPGELRRLLPSYRPYNHKFTSQRHTRSFLDNRPGRGSLPSEHRLLPSHHAYFGTREPSPQLSLHERMVVLKLVKLLLLML